MPIFNGLSDYQQGILSEMGIPCFYQSTDIPAEQLVSKQPVWQQDLMALCSVDTTVSLPPGVADYVSRWKDEVCLTVEQKRQLWRSLCAVGYKFGDD